MTHPAEPAEYHLNVTDEPAQAAELLAQHSGLSKQRIKHCMKQGAVWLTRGAQTQRLRRATRPLKTGDALHLYYNPQIVDATPPQPALIADEGDYSVWHKPSGMLSQGTKWGDHNSIARWAEQQLEPQRPGFIVHRLDRAASGLILVAHSKTAARQLTQLFEQRAVEKEYQAIVHGLVEIKQPPLTLQTKIDGRAACSHVSVLETGDDRSLVEVKIETGRKHQIRRHLAGIGHPIVGDRLYGNEQPGADHDIEDLQLTACRLGFVYSSPDTEGIPTPSEKRYALPPHLQLKL